MQHSIRASLLPLKSLLYGKNWLADVKQMSTDDKSFEKNWFGVDFYTKLDKKLPYN